MPLLSHEKVMKFLQLLNVKKSTGTDEIGPRLLKIASPFISESLAYICNLSIRNGSFPDKWKEALVVLGLTTLLDSISVYIGPSPREREIEKRSDR